MNVVSNYKTTLSASMTSVQVTVPVSSVLTTDGHTIVIADVGTTGYLVIEPGSAKQEIISFTGISGNSFTGVTRGLAFYGTSSSSVPANCFAHQAGSVVIMSNVQYIYKSLVDLDSAQTVGGVKTFTSSPIIPTGGTGTQAANATDIANAVTGASGTATNAVNGTVKLSVAAASAPNPIAVGTNDPRVPTANQSAALAGTGTPAVGNPYVTQDTDALKELLANKDATTTLGTSDTKYPTQKAVKTYVDTQIPLGTAGYLFPQTILTDTSAATGISAGSIYTGIATADLYISTKEGTPYIYKFVKDTNTNFFYYSAVKVAVKNGYSSYLAHVTVLGNYVYSIHPTNGGGVKLERYDIGTLANGADMTISGKAPQDTNAIISICTDGTFLYMYDVTTGGQINKYSVSGTTATYVSAVNLTSYSTNGSGLYCDGTYFYQFAADSNALYKWPMAGGALTSTTTVGFGGSALLSTMAAINTTKLELFYATTATNRINTLPITKP